MPLKVVVSQPARPAGRVKKKFLQNPEFFVRFTKGLHYYLKSLKIHPVLLADEFTSSKITHNANFTKI